MDWSVGLSIRGAWLTALESLIRTDMIASKQILLAHAFPDYGIHAQLGSHRCCPELDFCKGLSQRLLSFYMCFHLLSSGRVSRVSQSVWCMWWFQVGGRNQGYWRRRSSQGFIPSPVTSALFLSCASCSHQEASTALGPISYFRGIGWKVI